jgi:cell division septum initiation protein DivIVA
MNGRAFRSIASLGIRVFIITLLLTTISGRFVSAHPRASVCGTDAVTRACNAEVARYTNQAESYTTRNLRSFQIAGARYTELAEAHTQRAIARQRAAHAEMARYRGLVSARHLRADRAASARYEVLATFHDASLRPLRAESERSTGLAIWYASLGD